MKTNKNLKKLVFLLGFMAFWVQGDNYASAPLIVEIAKEFNLEISTAALSVTAYMLPFGLFTLLFGPLADRFGKARIINTAAFITGIFSALGAVAYDINSLSIIRAVNGTFAAGILPVTMALIGDKFGHEPKSVQNALGQVFGLMFLGGAIAPAIGGTLSYFGSWRLVYLVYGIAELIIAFIMLRVIEKEPGTTEKLSLQNTYGSILTDTGLLKTVSLLFLVGFAVFGSFTYAGKFIEDTTGYNILIVGLILTFFGITTFLGGRKSGNWKEIIGNKILLYAGILGLIFWSSMGFLSSTVLISLSLIGFALAFIIIQPTLVTTAQQLNPKRRGTVMSLVSFNMFVGGGIGTFLNGQILNRWGFEFIFLVAGIIIFLAGLAGTLVLSNLSQKKTGNP